MAYYGYAVVFGMWLGAFGVLMTGLFMERVQALELRRYLLERDDKTRKQIGEELDEIQVALEEIVDRTNSKMFKRKLNSFYKFRSFLKEFKIN